MISKALWVPLQAKPGKEADVEAFLDSGLDGGLVFTHRGDLMHVAWSS